MDKIGSPRGLIRYSTENALANRLTSRDIFARLWRPRTLLYASILFLIVALSAWQLATRIPFKVNILRDRLTPYREADDGRIENIYTLRLINTDENTHRYEITVKGIKGLEVIDNQTVEVPAASNKTILLVAAVKEDGADKGPNKIVFHIRAVDHHKIAVREKSVFFMPGSHK